MPLLEGGFRFRKSREGREEELLFSTQMKEEGKEREEGQPKSLFTWQKGGKKGRREEGRENYIPRRCISLSKKGEKGGKLLYFGENLEGKKGLT